MTHRSHLLPALSLMGLLLGCSLTPHQAYRNRQCRTQPVTGGLYDAECFTSDGGPENGRCSTESHPGYDLAFLEFDDQGDYWEPCELDRANYIVDQANEKARREDPQRGGALVVVFVHGWRNDASEANGDDGNLANFKSTLEGLVDLEAACRREAQSADQRTRCAPQRPVVGIYVGWRGDLIKTVAPLHSIDWLFDWATFWNRNAAAQRIASRPIATQALLLLLENVKAENSNARVIVVGHSMGALLLEQAISQTLVTRIIDKLYQERDRSFIPIRPLADLVVLVNSAAPAFRAQSLVDTLQIREARLDLEPLGAPASREMPSPPPAAESGPLLVSVTARNDHATGWLFPKALALETRNQQFRPSTDPAGDRPAEKYLARHTPGHTPQLFSHKELDYRKEERPCLPKGTAAGRRLAEWSGAAGVTYCSESSEDGATLAFSVQANDGFETYRLVREPTATNKACIGFCKSLQPLLMVIQRSLSNHSVIFSGG